MAEVFSFMTLSIILSIVLFGVSLVIPGVVLALWASHRSYGWSLMLKHALFFNVGCLFLTGFMGQLLYGPEIAASLAWGWSPFQYELAFSELSLAILGLLSPLFYEEFWLATIIAACVWLLGGAGVHLYYLFMEGNEAILNAGFAIGWNIFIACWLILLYSGVARTSCHILTRCTSENE